MLKLSLFIAINFLVTISFAQQYNIRNFGLKEGLPAPNVNSVCQDHEGYIWFATQNGICRYNGNDIKIINLNPSISSIDATYIMEDTKDRIWIGTTHYGVFYIDGGEIKNVTTENGLPNNWVNSVFEDHKGQIWISTDAGVAYMNGSGINTLMDKDSILSGVIYCVSEDQKNQMLFGTVNSGLIIKSKDKFIQYSSENYTISNSIYSISVTENNTLVVGTTDNGVYFFKDEKIFKLDVPEMKDAWISKSIIQNDKAFFVTSYGLVEYNLNTKKYNIITSENGLVSNDLFSGIFDVNNNLWLTSGDNGVSVIRNENIQSLNESYGLSSNKISSLDIASDSIIIVSTSNKGINFINSKTNKITQLTNEELETGISVVKTINNEIWIGGGFYSKGISIYEYRNGEIAFKSTIDSIKGIDINIIHEVIEDKTGNIWVATYGAGLFKIKGSDTTRFSTDNILKGDDILAFYIDRQNRSWISIYNEGVFLMENGSIKDINKLFNLIEINVECINQDLHGNILLGNKTEGLTIISDDLMDINQVKDKFLSNHVNDIEIDENNNIWIGTDLGINRIKLNSKLEVKEIKSINELNGLISSEIVKKGLAYSNGILWVATPDGISKLKASDIDKKHVKNIIALNNVKLFFKNVNWEKFDDIKVDRFGVPKSLKLPYTQNYITFDFNTISINEQKYSYILEGWDSEWTPYSSLNSAVYSNLQPGEYIFKVKSIDNFDSQSANVFEIPVTIYPPFWQTWWFKILLASIVILIIYFLFKIRTKALLKRQVELEKTVNERTKEVVAEKREVELQKHLVEEKNQEISDSINYAERIQRAMLANEKLLKQYLKDYFIFFQPKDVVSGDFYWASLLSNKKLALVNADSTGHGVPGAIMSMLNMNSLREAVKGNELTEPHDILNHTRKIVKESLSNDGSAEGGKDGMDCSLMVFDLENNQIQFAAANNPVWIIRNEVLLEFKGDKMPVGKHDRDSESFTTQTVELEKGDVIYTLTDGMPDQFGGPKGKKFMYKRLKVLLIEISKLSMSNQHDRLKSEMDEWMGSEEQVDDVCIIGVRI